MTELKKIYVAAALLSRYPLICKAIYDVCDREGVEFVILCGCCNLWVRDFMPIPVGDGKYAKFNYGKEWSKYPSLRDCPKSWAWVQGVFPVNLFLDGGNVVMNDRVAFVTDKFTENNDGDDSVFELEEILDHEVYIIPAEPGDDSGHVDGILNFAPDGSIFVNDYRVMKSDEYDEYLAQVTDILDRAGFNWRLFPFAYHKMPKMTEKEFRDRFPFGDTFNPAVGYYINWVVIGKTVLLPKFGFEEDSISLNAIKASFIGYSVEQVDCYDLSCEGGLLRCVTWNT